MKRLATLLIGILLSINTFSQHYVLDEIVVIEPKTQEIIEIVKKENSLIKEIFLSNKVGVVTIENFGVNNKYDSKEIVKIEKEGVEDDDYVIYGKNQFNDHVRITHVNNGMLFIEYGSTYSIKDIEKGMYFFKK